MQEKALWLVLLALVFENRCGHGEEVNCAQEPKCGVYPSHGMKVADCYGKDFYSMPKCITTGIEVLELSHNRIRTVTNSDLTRYNYLKLLYLTDNLLTTLDDDTFTGMDSIDVLDLSVNSLLAVPSSIFHLSSLRTLKLQQNRNLDINASVQKAKPVSSPLSVVDISLTADNPQDFPDFGPLPFLTTLNITGNRYISITPTHFAGLCNLKRLVNNDTNVDYNDYCDCWIINRWLNERDVQFVQLVCPLPENKCLGKVLSVDDEKIYDQCKEMYGQIQQARTLTKVGIGIGVAVLIAAVIVCLYFWCRRRKRNGRQKRREEDRKRIDGLTLLDKEPKNIHPNNN